jgi:hypothetical protein
MLSGMKKSSNHKEQKKSSSRRNRIWTLIAKALGEKAGKNNKEADRIASIRLLMFLSIFITNGFIIANAIRHWNDVSNNISDPIRCIIVNK